MKKLLIIILWLVAIQASYSQGVGEWFNQKKTQTKYLVQQIAALKVYTEYLEKGYDIAKKGLGTIQSFTNGEFNLHNVFFGTLKAVSPKIKKYPRLADIIIMEAEIIQHSSKVYRSVKGNGVYHANEIEYVGRVFDRVLKDVESTISDLSDIITDDKYLMSDDERIERIEKLYLIVRGTYLFTKEFCDETIQLGAERSHEKEEIDLMWKW